MLNERLHQEIQTKCIQIIGKDVPVKIKMQEVADLLRNEISHYDWVGFYLKKGTKDELRLGPFSGEPTVHKVIPFGSGICGRVAVEERTINVDDVNAEDNYIACSLNTKSELVVPIMKAGEFKAQLDIDSNQSAAFSIRDERLIQSICRRFAELME